MIAELTGATRAAIGGLAQWHEVGEIIRAPDWDISTWDEEEDERTRLWHRAGEHHDEQTLLLRLTSITDSLAGEIGGAANLAAAMGGISDAGLVKAASSAALMAAHQNALANLAGEGARHFFVRKYALFERGRWPLGMYRGQYYVF